MDIGYYKLSEMDNVTKERLMRRSETDIEDVMAQIQPIIEDVRQNGDEALFKYAEKFDKAQLSNLKVTEEEFAEARQTLDPYVKTAIDHCAGNVRKFHAEQVRRMERDKEWMIEVEKGVFAGEKVTPISSVGLYVPGGKNQYCLLYTSPSPRD